MDYIKKGKINLIIDGQWGSTGKGKLAGYIAKRASIDVAVCDFQTNAGHTFVCDDGKEIMVQQVPSALINPGCQICIAPAATINVDTLMKEIEKHDLSKRIHIHPHAGVIEDIDTANEAKGAMVQISSTQKGCGSSLSRKIRREASLACNCDRLRPFIADTCKIVQDTLFAGGTVLGETAQGFDLSLNHGIKYPYTTSRDVTVGSSLNNFGVPPMFLGEVWASLRTYPIRVGNVFDKDGKQIGWSGPNHVDQNEMTWDEITNSSGCPHRLEEITTVTKKVRRVFNFSLAQLDRFITYNAPTKLFINFVNYLNWDDHNKMFGSELSSITKTWVHHVEEWMNEFCSERRLPIPKIALLGTGSKDSSMVELG